MPRNLHRLRSIWLGTDSGDGMAEEWPANGVAIEGDFAGIQGFVLRPVPGAGGAAKRLRGRSLRVVALTQLIAEKILTEFGSRRARPFFLAGGRFLIVAPESSNWEERLRATQDELDRWLANSFQGEITFHLAGTRIGGPQIPVSALHQAMETRRRRPLGYALAPSQWCEELFFRRAIKNSFRCPACLRTSDEPMPVHDENNRYVCPECLRDRDIGAQVAAMSRPRLVRLDAAGPAKRGEIAFLDAVYAVRQQDGLPLRTVHWTPRSLSGDVLDFAELSRKATGRQWLAYLRMDGDQIGEQFRQTQGDPRRTWALSNFLQTFFCEEVQDLIATGYKDIYPVYGGGDDLFVIGPWDHVFRFALDLALRFSEASEGRLSFSAGVALARPREHILTKSDEAEHALSLAKQRARVDKRGFIHALGCTVGWPEYKMLLVLLR